MWSTLFLQVNPQFYAFRWITLLLTQEFDFLDCLRLWDSLLSNPDGPLVSNLPWYWNLFHLRSKSIFGHLMFLCPTVRQRLILLLTSVNKRTHIGFTSINYDVCVFTQEILLRVCCAMLLCVRSRLLAGDFTTNLKLLQNYPTVDIHHLLRVAEELRGWWEWPSACRFPAQSHNHIWNIVEGNLFGFIASVILVS